MQEMAKRMERDARLMKFLADVTAFFLPLTGSGSKAGQSKYAELDIPNDAASQFLAWTFIPFRKLRKELYPVLTSSSTPGCTGRVLYQSQDLLVSFGFARGLPSIRNQTQLCKRPRI